jgi:hypothetical protein
LTLDLFRERAASRYGEGVVFRLGDALFTFANLKQGTHAEPRAALSLVAPPGVIYS